MKLSRHDKCELFNKIASQDESQPKKSMNQELTSLYNKETLTLKEARQARRDGFFKRASDDLYENAETKSFWKIDKESGMVKRIVNVDGSGFVKE